MVDENPGAPGPIPFSGYLDLALALIVPLVGASFVLPLLFWVLVRPSVPDSAVGIWVVAVFTVGLMLGVINAFRHHRRAYRRPRGTGGTSART